VVESAVIEKVIITVETEKGPNDQTVALSAMVIIDEENSPKIRKNNNQIME
jgi:hypothetical protein